MLNCSLFCRHLIVPQYLGVLLATCFMLLAVATGCVFFFSLMSYTKPFILKFYPDRSILNSYRARRSHPFLDTASHLPEI